MSQYKRIGIDTSKAVFTLHGIDHADRPTLRLNLRRAQMIAFFSKLPPTGIAMEACGGSHHWARELTALGHEVRLMPPQYVTPCVKRGKNDHNDAAAACEASGRPGMHFVPFEPRSGSKSTGQQAQGMVLKVRETLVDQRTQLCNALRGHAAEFGVIAGKGRGQAGALLTALEQEPVIPPEAKELLTALEQEPVIPPEAKEMFVLLGRQIEHLDARIKAIEVKLAAAHKANAVSQRLATSAADAFRHIGSLRDPIPGVGPVTALTLAIEIDPGVFESGRHLAAWAGLTPKEHSAGGKQRMGGISRTGNERLRVLLVSGATAVINAAMRPAGRQMTEWLRALLLRKPRKLAAVALANKMARTAWAMMKSGEPYRRPSTFGAAPA